MDRIKRNKSIKLLKLSLIIGYLSVLLFITYLICYMINDFNNFNLIIFKGENLPFIISFSLLLISFIFGFIIPITIHQNISIYRRTLYDNRDNNRLVTAINYVKNGNLEKTIDISNTINSPKRKSFLLGIITGISLSDNTTDLNKKAIYELNNFKYK